MSYKFVLIEKSEKEGEEDIVLGIFSQRSTANLAKRFKFHNSGAKCRVVSVWDYKNNEEPLTYPHMVTHIYGYALVDEGKVVVIETTKPSRINRSTFIRHEGFIHTGDGYHFLVKDHGVIEYYAPYNKERVDDFKLKVKKRINRWLKERTK